MSKWALFCRHFTTHVIRKDQAEGVKNNEQFDVISDVLFKKIPKGPSTAVIPKVLRDHICNTAFIPQIKECISVATKLQKTAGQVGTVHVLPIGQLV